VIRNLLQGMEEFIERNASRGWNSLEDFRGLRRNAVVAHSQIKRPDQLEYHGGYEEEHEGYARPEPSLTTPR
jgi:hypothetical protein